MNFTDPDKTVLVASDVHLGSISAEQQGAFLSWLKQASEVTSHIVLNGDLFDFWFEYIWGHTAGAITTGGEDVISGTKSGWSTIRRRSSRSLRT